MVRIKQVMAELDTAMSQMKEMAESGEIWGQIQCGSSHCCR